MSIHPPDGDSQSLQSSKRLKNDGTFLKEEEGAKCDLGLRHLRRLLNLTMAAIGNAESLEKITAALRVFSTSTDKQQIANANEWLQDFQHTVSWSPLCGVHDDAELEPCRSVLGRSPRLS